MDINFESLFFKKPKKCGDYFICKLNEDIVIQFPKMKILSITDKLVELEFINDTSGYYKKIYDYLSNLDDFVIGYIHKYSKEWFDKNIPLENIKQMYNKFIKSPKTSDSKCSLNFILKKNEIKTIDNKNNEIELSEISVSDTVECISQFKYIVFSKDTCFITWELHSMKKKMVKIEKVKKYGFIEDKEEEIISDSEDLESIECFF